MGYTTSTVHGIEVPDSSEANNIPEDIGKVVTALEGGSIIRRLTSAAISALTAPQKPAGLMVFNTTAGVMQVSDGTNFRDVPSLASSGAWTAWTPTLTQGGTVTWSGNRARYLQVGKTIHAYCWLAVTGAGTAGQIITLSLPVTAVAVGAGGGAFSHFDVGNVTYSGWAAINSTTLLAFSKNGDNQAHGINSGTLTNGDTLSVSITYEVA